MRTGEVAESAGVSVRALRYYEEQGLVIADRSPSGHRQYAESAVERVKFIQLLYSAGLGSKAILQVLPFLTLSSRPHGMTQRLKDERDRIRTQIDDLTRAHDRLNELMGFATESAVSPATCSASVDAAT